MSRYSMHLRVIAITLLMMPAIVIADGNEKSSGDGSPPVVVRKLAKNAPPPVSFRDGEAYAVCSLDENGWPLSRYCSVVQSDGLTYWPMSFKNNRYAILVVGYDGNSKMVKTIYACGTRYIWSITMDGIGRKAIFWGQKSGVPPYNPTTVAIPWGLFRNDGANVDLCH
jgi:hypothetical protein